MQKSGLWLVFREKTIHPVWECIVSNYWNDARLQNNIDDYTNKKDQIAKDKMKAEDIGEKIKFLREVLATMQADLKVVRELKGGIDGNL